MAEGERIVEAQRQRIGEAVAYVPPGKGHRSLWVFGELVMYKTRSGQTGGAYSLFEEIGEAAMDDSRPPVPADQQHMMKKIIAIATEYGIEIPSPDRPYGGQEGIPE
jgi:hypothetical protein